MTIRSTSRLEDALAVLRSGGAVLLTDEERGGLDLVTAASRVAAEVLSRLVDDGRGPLVVVTPETPPGPAHPVQPYNHAAEPDLAAALARLGDGRIRPDVERLTAAAGGVLTHPRVCEAAADLLRIAGAGSSALLRSVALEGGVLASSEEARDYADRSGFGTVSVQDVVAHRLETETLVTEIAAARLPSRFADEPLEVHAFRNNIDGSEHLALVRRPPGLTLGPEPLVRLHSECLTGDALGSLRCDCGEQLRGALKLISEDRQGGVVIYLRGQEGRGIGLANKIRAYALQDRGFDTVDANTELGFLPDLRNYGIAVQILKALRITRLRLLSNNPDKQAALERYGISVTQRQALRVGPNPHNALYLETKRLRMGHDLARAPDVTESDPPGTLERVIE